MNERRFGALCMGFTTVDQAITGVSVGDLVREAVCPAKDVTFGVGGDAMNEASVLARLGIRTRLATKLGNDFLAQIVLDHCKREGIDVSAVKVDPVIGTTVGIAVIGDQDDRRIIPVAEGRSTDLFEESDVDPAIFREAKVVSFGSMFVVPKFTPEVMAHVFREIKEAGCILCADVKMSGTERIEDIACALPYVDYLFPNFAEARLLTGETDPRRVAQRFLDAGLKTVVLKLGEPGCYIRSSTEELWVPSYIVDAVDSTGAGDTFAAGFISGLVRDLSLKECAKLACAASSICVQHVGAVGGVQDLAQVEAVIAAGEADWAERAARVSTAWKVDDTKKTL